MHVLIIVTLMINCVKVGTTKEDKVYDEEEPEVLKSELEATIKELKVAEAAGMEGIASEVLKVRGLSTVKMKTIIDAIWDTGI